MPNPKDDFKDRLARYRQIKISVIGRKSGRTISIPVWFVLEGEKLYLLHVLKNPQIGIEARGTESAFRTVSLTDAKAVKSVVEKFRGKYGATDVKKYYSNFDVAGSVELG
jgi:hypothetical protein